MLNRMPRFMAGNADSGDRGISVYTLRKAYDIASRVVMVGQIAGDLLYANVLQSVCIKHTACRFGTCDAAHGAYL